MKKANQTIWTTDDDRELLVQKTPGQWYIPLSNVNLQTLRELGAAIANVVQAAETPKCDDAAFEPPKA